MKLTVKDKDFLEKLKKLMDEKYLDIDLKNSPYAYFVLKGNYGDKIENEFKMSRQGVRWRFWRIFNEIYIEAYQTIFWVEKYFGTHLREKAIEVERQRLIARKKIKQADFVSGLDYGRKHEN